MLELKGDPGRARIFNADFAMAFALTAAHAIWQMEGRTLVVTSCGDGTHSGKTRGHARGLAFDCRTQEKRPGVDGLMPGRLDTVAALLTNALGLDFQVLIEFRGESREHLHVEYLTMDIEP